MPENSPEIKAFIRDYSYLFWYTPDQEKEHISAELLIEMVFNYGDLDAVRRLFSVMGIERVAAVFFAMGDRKKLNFYPEIHHFFFTLLTKYA